MSSQSRSSASRRIERDVKMVFDLFVETLQGAIPGQMYVVSYQRGSKEQGSSEPTRANEHGVVEFKFHRAFVSTIQRKNSTSYKKKEMRIFVVEHPTGVMVSDLVYDIAGPVDNEVFPHKKLMVKSPDGQGKLLFSLSGIAEDDYIRLNSDRVAAIRRDPSASVATGASDVSRGQTQERDDGANEVSRSATQTTERRRGLAEQQRQQRQEPQQQQLPSQQQQQHLRQRPDHGRGARASEADDDDDDDDFDDIVDGAVSQMSSGGRKGSSARGLGGSAAAPGAPASRQGGATSAKSASSSVPPLSREESLARGGGQRSASPQPRVDLSQRQQALSAPPVDDRPTPYAEGDLSAAPPPPPPPPRPAVPQNSQPAASAAAVDRRPSPARQDASVPASYGGRQPRRTDGSADAARTVPFGGTVMHEDPFSGADAAGTSRSASTAMSATAILGGGGGVVAAVSGNTVDTNHTQSFSTPTTSVPGRVERDVERYLSEIQAAMVAMADHTKSNVPATASTGKHTYNFVSGTKTASSIPRASLLVLHCLKYWSGNRRWQFIHDFIALLFVDVIPFTRLAAQWMSVLLHVLYHVLATVEDDAAVLDPDNCTMSDDAAIQLAENLETAISNAEECGFGTRNTFLVRGSRTDRLAQLLPKEPEYDAIAGPGGHVAAPLLPATSILVTLAIDEALRRLADVAASEAMDDVVRFLFPPSMPPTRRTSNGYHYEPPNIGTVAATYGVGGGGADHVTQDPAFSVVLNSLTKLYTNLHGATKDQPSGASALLRIVNQELFKIVFRNVNNTLLNRCIVRDTASPQTLASRVRTVRDGLNFKLALSMLEQWQQEHNLFIATSSELLGCRQVCDLIILQKRLLRNVEVSDEVSSGLPPQLVVTLLECYEANQRDLDVDEVPPEVLQSFRRAADEAAKAQRRSGSTAAGVKQQPGFTDLPLRPLSSFPFADFVTTLLPRDDIPGPGEGSGRGPSGDNCGAVRKSLRASLHVTAKPKDPAGGFGVTDASRSPSTATNSVGRHVLEWDHPDRALTGIRNRESLLGLSATHDPTGRAYSDEERVEAERRIALRLAALSVADDEVIQRMVV